MAAYARCLLVVLLIPVVSAFNELLAHQKSHESASVRLLKTDETVNESGSDLVFNWEKCVICDGYDIRLYLQDSSRKEEFHYQLKAAVTALKVPNLHPRTNYKLVIRALPTNSSSSEVSGRSFSPEAPPPVEKLTARAVTSTSIKIEWESQNADGFILQVFDNDTEIHKRPIPDFSLRSSVKITDLKPETKYRIQVTAFYFPPTGKSMSAVSSVQVKTLPVILPSIQLNWRLNPQLELFWKNPEFPLPVIHNVVCTRNSRSIFAAKFSGSTEFVAPSIEVGTEEVQCSLESFFSDDVGSNVRWMARIRKPAPPTTENPSVANEIDCSGSSYSSFHAVVRASVAYSLEERDGIELLVLRLTHNSHKYAEYSRISYKICEEDGTCRGDWIESREQSRIVVDPGAVEAWVPHIVKFYFQHRCKSTYDSESLQSTDVGSLKIPPLIGTVEPVVEFTATSEQVSWIYNSSSVQPDHFLVTYCVGDHCTSQTAPGKDRSLKLGGLKERRVYFATIQAVMLWKDRLYVSPTKMASFIAPKSKIAQTVNLSANEVANSSTIRLLIEHDVTSDAPPIVKYHIAVCGRPVALWADPALAGQPYSSNASCESMVSTESSLDLKRQPWTAYEFSVVLCYGTYDFNDPVNLTLPIFKQDPAPVTGLTWDQGNTTLSWIYESSLLSGFSIRICPAKTYVSRNCSIASANPLERQYKVDASHLSDGGSVATVIPFVTYHGRNYNGPESELEIRIASTTPATTSSTTETITSEIS